MTHSIPTSRFYGGALIFAAAENTQQPSRLVQHHLPLTPHDENDKSPSTYHSDPTVFLPNSMAEGYFDAFFRVEKKLGRGANGSVLLCQHVLDNIPLGRFAVKKIAIATPGLNPPNSPHLIHAYPHYTS
ncbi:hypothetical protein D9758_012638 [Tetrapyrgos nigripes]|uniref:Protein kinase domain-containing protein n=1 Tax=Tetrapyrgos nigripes TaxID=182062 RepID=A0A8H5LMX7_9AGAR|nr:hypothetical protein D9758_012638 [Tetrapyrgos nigripes]